MFFDKNSVEMHGTRAGWCRFVCNNLQIGDTEDLHVKHIAKDRLFLDFFLEKLTAEDESSAVKATLGFLQNYCFAQVSRCAGCASHGIAEIAVHMN